MARRRLKMAPTIKRLLKQLLKKTQERILGEKTQREFCT